VTTLASEIIETVHIITRASSSQMVQKSVNGEGELEDLVKQGSLRNSGGGVRRLKKKDQRKKTKREGKRKLAAH